MYVRANTKANLKCSSLRLLQRRGNRYSTSQAVKPLASVLIANRGEIALRVGKTASTHGIRFTTLYTDPDAQSQHALSSPFAVNLGDSKAYLDGNAIINVAKREGCDSIHPGYGFLSENASFARSCADAGINFIGPPPNAMESMGNKSRSKEIMTAANVPCVPGYHGANQDLDFLATEAGKIGYPVLLKAVKGGGGKGMRISQSAEDFHDQLQSAKSEAKSSFSDDTMLVEKYIRAPRHIEVQIFADKHGNCVALGERDCSVQRRHQKIIEESPAPNLDEKARQSLWEKARAAALAVNYEGAGTVEFIFDNDSGDFYFMEMNTRLQVEHPVTEMVTGQDLVHWQFQIAEGRPLPLTQAEIHQNILSLGWAFEARIYAENPEMNFVPDSGKIVHLRTPKDSNNVRIDAGFIAGDEVSPHYDPMIAKLIVRGSDRREALQKLHSALQSYQISGLSTNVEFLKNLCKSREFADGNIATNYIPTHQQDLFPGSHIQPEVWAQAALGALIQQVQLQSSAEKLVPPGTSVGFGSGYQVRASHFSVVSGDASEQAPASAKVILNQVSRDTFNISVDDRTFDNVRCVELSNSDFQTFFQHTRLESTVIRYENFVTVFQQGRQYNLQYVLPKWTEKALGVKDVANSVFAPMPCKILRVDVSEGDEVIKDQPLVVIESMKMETVIRSPQNGVVSKVVHKAGDMCKAGTALVEFATSAET